jgi:small subunit ribosomal protein S2
MAIPTMKQLLEAGVHFGHQTRRWDPRMKPYIFTERNGIHIVDLQQTMKNIKIVHSFVKSLAEAGKTVLFVGTKKQAQQTIADEATRCEMFYINQRWMGGTLTNFQTIKRSIMRLQKYEEAKAEGHLALLPRKEQSSIEKICASLNKSLGGIKKMKALPGAVFIVDPKREELAIAEAKKLGIPVIALADTNCNPEKIDFVIPGNDDAIRAINLITAVISSAVMAGRMAAKDAASAPDLLADDEEVFAPSDAELESFESFEEDFEEDAEEEVLRKRRLATKTALEQGETPVEEGEEV